jgi:hypothetical protein
MDYYLEGGTDMSFFDWLSSAPSIPIPDPPRPESGPREDVFDEPVVQQALNPADEDRDGIPDTIAGVCVTIEYCDAAGEISNRRVLIERLYYRNDGLYLGGWCMLRNARRTFRADRIQELLLPPKWIAVDDPYRFLEGYISPPSPAVKRQRDEPSPPQSADYWERRYKVRSVANHGLRVLAFMARVDGAFVLQERNVLCTYIKDIGVVAGIKLSDDESNDIASEADTLFPTKRQVANSLNVIRLYQEQSSIFLKSLNQLVRSDGTISSWEQNAMRMLIDILKKQAA